MAWVMVIAAGLLGMVWSYSASAPMGSRGSDGLELIQDDCSNGAIADDHEPVAPSGCQTWLMKLFDGGHGILLS